MATTKDDAPPLRHETTHLHCVKTNRTDAPLLRHDKRRTSIASRNDAPPLRHDKTTNGVPHLDGTARRRTSVASRKHETKRRTSVASRNEAYERTNETAFAPPLQRHEHEPQDRNERHEQRRRPLN